MIPLNLNTERLRLLIPGPAYAEPVLEYFVRNRSHLEPWEPQRVRGFYTVKFWRDQLAFSRDEAEAGLSGRYFLIDAGRLGRDALVVGTANFTSVVDGVFAACVLGYGLDANKEGQGLMYEALARLIPAFAQARHLHRVMANYRPENTRSGRLLERLGFIVEGLARDYLYIDGAWRDHVLTARIFPECPAPDLDG